MILLFLKGNKNKGVYLSIYLEAVKTANMSEGWSRDVKVKFVLFNKRNTNMTITKETRHDLNAKEVDWHILFFQCSFSDFTFLFSLIV
ncbi:hypothetical protein P8452_65438 [Trifolium repens]|nr:hypothetical protein P8452_65438 [Trifolium repens]